MVIQVWITILLLAAIVIGVAWALFYRPLVRRWQMETRQEEEARRQAELEKEQREKAMQEIQRDCYTASNLEKQETPQQQESKQR